MILDNSEPDFQYGSEFGDTYLPWYEESDSDIACKQCVDGKPIDEICQHLKRFPDDVIEHLGVHFEIDPEDIEGFGGPCHIALWKQQQEAFRVNPLFKLRKEIQRESRVVDIEKNIQELRKWR